jgi:hypothetical protein
MRRGDRCPQSGVLVDSGITPSDQDQIRED